jgi:hypothetical protein
MINVLAPLPVTGLGKSNAMKDDTTAADLLAGQFDDIVRSASIHKEVAVAMAACLDSFVASWKDEAKEEHRRVAHSMVNDAFCHLSANIFASSNGQLVAPMRAQTTQPTSSSNSSVGQDSAEQSSSVPSRTSWITV